MPPTPALVASLLFAASASPDADVEIENGPSLPPYATEHGKASTGDASTLDPGVLETEFAYAPVWNDSGAAFGFDPALTARTHLLRATATRGLVQDLDAKVSVAFGNVFDAGRAAAGPAPTTGMGLGDVVVGARWRFLNLPAHALELALAGEAVIPVGTRDTATQIGLSQGFWSARLALVGSKDVDRFTLNGELGCIFPAGDSGGLASVLQANAAAGFHVAPWLQPELELNYQAAVGPGSHALLATAGVVVPWGAGNRLVAAIQRGVWGSHAVQTTGALLAYKTAF